MINAETICHVSSHTCHVLQRSTKNHVSVMVWIDHGSLQVPPIVTMSTQPPSGSFCLCFSLVLWTEGNWSPLWWWYKNEQRKNETDEIVVWLNQYCTRVDQFSNELKKHFEEIFRWKKKLIEVLKMSNDNLTKKTLWDTRVCTLFHHTIDEFFGFWYKVCESECRTCDA